MNRATVHGITIFPSIEVNQLVPTVVDIFLGGTQFDQAFIITIFILAGETIYYYSRRGASLGSQIQQCYCETKVFDLTLSVISLENIFMTCVFFSLLLFSL